MTDILGDGGIPVDAKKYERDKPRCELIERLFGAAACIFRRIVPEGERTEGRFATDLKLSILHIERGAKALGGYSVLFATVDGMQEHYFGADNICVDPNDNTEIGYVVGPDAPIAPNSRAARNAARLDAMREDSLVSTKQSALAT